MNRILVLSPHTDDSEISSGGSIYRWLQEGHDVKIATFSCAKQSLVEAGLEENTLIKEMKCAFKKLGVTNYQLFDYPVRRFQAHRQEILDDLIRLRSEFNPALVVMPTLNDTHQDHATISSEGFRAFKHSSILGYEMPQNNLTFPANMFITLTDVDIMVKMEAISCYKSQRTRPYISDEFPKHLAKVRGIQAGSKYAEAFTVLRWIQ